ncbi:PilZ domain-containing protein [Aestuariibius sp. HNIBRBA575]|uniref:PilZ domain-containing protein n=1 Tax=Aestuariibius sp. HNIBRBA575 TaxID=3233343 RepID=UPI0034A2A941
MRYRSNRLPSQTLVNLRRETGVVLGDLRNISQGGARVHGVELEAGEKLTMEMDDLMFPCWVIWARDNMAGIRFDKMITPSQVSLLRQERSGPSTNQRPLRSFGTRH